MSKAPQITLDQFKSQAKARKVYIFAVNLEGIGFLKLFTRLGLNIGGFIDSRPIPGASKRGQPVIHPDKFFADLAARRWSVANRPGSSAAKPSSPPPTSAITCRPSKSPAFATCAAFPATWASPAPT
jgi:hypothetical protein